MKQLTITESLEQLLCWGRAFRKVAEEKPNGTAYKFYQVCVDAHEGLKGKPFHFHPSKAALRAGLEAIATQHEREIRQRILPPEYQQRADFYRVVACFFEEKPILEHQISLF